MRWIPTSLFLACVAATALPCASLAQDASAPPATASSFVSGLSLESLIASVKKWAGWSPAVPPLLPPEEAFKVAILAERPDRLSATLTAAPGYYLYRERIAFRIEAPAGTALQTIELPAGNIQQDPTFGKVAVYYGTVKVDLLLDASTQLSTPSVRVRVAYQGCNNPRGVCYPPMQTLVTVPLAGKGVSNQAAHGDLSAGPR